MKKQLLLLAMMLLPMVASADAVEIDGIWYNLVSKIKTAEVANKPSGKYSGAIVIPEKVTYDGAEYSVTSIGNYAFCNCTGLTSIVIPNSVTSIDIFVFNGCTALATITIGNGIKKIGIEAFANCTALRDFYCYALNVPNIKVVNDFPYTHPFDGTPIENATLHVPVVANANQQPSAISIGECRYRLSQLHRILHPVFEVLLLVLALVNQALNISLVVHCKSRAKIQIIFDFSIFFWMLRENFLSLRTE